MPPFLMLRNMNFPPFLGFHVAPGTIACSAVSPGLRRSANSRSFPGMFFVREAEPENAMGEGSIISENALNEKSTHRL
jgi:hypothetical protein